jgi:hypothetical protein
MTADRRRNVVIGVGIDDHVGVARSAASIPIINARKT